MDVRQRIYSLVGRMKIPDVVKHFQAEGVPRRTIYHVIKRFQDGIPCYDNPRTGRPPKINQKCQENLRNTVENRVGISQRRLALKFNVSKTCIQENLKKMDLKYFKRQRAPKYTEKQVEQIPKKCRKLRREIIDSDTFIICDDEKYFTFSGVDMPGNAGFYSSDKEKTPVDVRFKPKKNSKVKY